MRQRKIAPFYLFRRGGADIAVYRNCELSRKRKLRELYTYSALLIQARPPTLKDLLFGDEPDENERRFLDDHDITKYVLHTPFSYRLSLLYIAYFSCCRRNDVVVTFH